MINSLQHYSLKKVIPNIKKNILSLLGKSTCNESTEPQIFRVRTQLLSKGRSDYTLARTKSLSIRIKCYAQGGENVLHTHPGQDHTFILLAGKAKFYGVNGEVTELTKNQGILIPEGFYHNFSSCGDEPLVMLRISAEKGTKGPRRIGIDGQPLYGRSKENNYQEKVPVEGLFYE
ncbi:MAG: cupin domain-containing protein [Xenococcaceae cyanobacterium]